MLQLIVGVLLYLTLAGEALAYKAGQFCDCATDAGTRKVLFHVSNLNTTGYEAMDEYRPNPYSNLNEPGGADTLIDTGRVWDNLFIQSWSSGTSPATAALILDAMPEPGQIQFDGEGGGSPPATPTYAPVRVP